MDPDETISLDALIEKEFAEIQECDNFDQGFFAAILEEVPQEDCRFGYYNGIANDLVSLFKRGQ